MKSYTKNRKSFPSVDEKESESSKIGSTDFATKEDEIIFRMIEELKKEQRTGDCILIGMNPDKIRVYEEIGKRSFNSFLVCSKGRKSEDQLCSVLRGMIASQRAFIEEEKKVYLFWKDTNWSQCLFPEKLAEKPIMKNKEFLFEELYNETDRRIDHYRKHRTEPDFQQVKKSWPWLIVFLRYSKKDPLPVQEWCEVASCWAGTLKIVPIFFCDEVLPKSQQEVFARVTNQLVFQASPRQLRSYHTIVSFTKKPYYEEEFLYWKWAHFLPLPEHLYVWDLSE